MADGDKEDLLALALSIVRGQTNVYIKELLRSQGVPIGATKEDFDRNLTKAIDDGVLTRQAIESWLNDVEGWGQQHVYAYRLSQDLQKAFSSSDKALEQVNGAGLTDYWQQSTTAPEMAWSADEDLHLVSITYEDSVRFHWHKGTRYWVRTKDEEKFDKPIEEIEGFPYQFRAYRGRSVREVMRFEIRPQDAMAALFIPKPIGSKEHQEAFDKAKQAIGSVLDFQTLEKAHLLVSNVIRNFDQAITLDKTEDASPQSTRLRAGAAYVEFGAIREDGSYLDSDDVKALRGGLRTQQDIGAYRGTSAKFKFVDDLGRVELSAEDNRIRLWSSLTADRVWRILRTLKAYEN